ncbi:MAG: dicarboxylate/amino acid:cation symporter, partial [Planococcaceae bacterium]|nr:dicarboxylate/amino acid:cation symporter [Planococcaceae bacterium]
MNLSVKIIIALVLGAITGILLNVFAPDLFPPLDKYLFSPVGKIFISLITMLVVPIVFISIALGTAGLGDPKKLGRIGLKTISYFLVTTSFAIVIGIGLAYLLEPGNAGTFETEGLEYSSEEAPPISETLLNIVPTNPIQSFAEANMLQIIVFAIFVGFALAMLGTKVDKVQELLEQGNEIMMYLVNLVMKFAPYGTFALLASAIGTQGLDAIKAMGLYMIVVVLALVIHGLFTYGSSILLLAKRNPISFFKGFAPAMGVAFSTSSSNATLPVSMSVAQKNLGVPKAISSFVQPLGA